MCHVPGQALLSSPSTVTSSHPTVEKVSGQNSRERPGEENRPSLETPIEDQAKVRSGDILLRDAYHGGNDTFHERLESAWAALKIDALKDAFGYPDEYQVDRDIVHQIASDCALERGQLLEPQSVEDLIHDLADAARFIVARVTRSEPLIAQLIAAGLPGLSSFYDAVAEEHAVGKAHITDHADGVDAVEVFRSRCCRRRGRSAPRSRQEGWLDQLGSQETMMLPGTAWWRDSCRV